MSITFGWYANAGLTSPLTRSDFVRSGVAGPVDRVVYFGSPAAGRQLQNAADPGVDPLQVELADGDDGVGVDPAEVSLALSAAGLDAATPGVPLVIGTTLLSGPANAVAVHVRVDSAITAIGEFEDVSLRVAGVLETAA